MEKNNILSERKAMLVGFIGVLLYGLSVVIKRNFLNIGLGMMVIASLFFIRNFNLKKLNTIQKLFLFLIILTPIFDLFSPGGIKSAGISIQKSYRFLPLFLAPIFLTTYERIKKFILFVNFSVLLNSIYVLNIYRKLGWNFNIRYETLENVQDTSHCLVALSYVVLAMIILSYREKNRLLFNISTATYMLSLFVIVISKTRGAWLALSFSMLFFLVIKLNKKSLIAIGIMMCSFLGILSINKESIKENIYYERIISIKDTKASSPRIRLMFWKASLDIFKENPIVGVGKDNSPEYFIKYFKNNEEFVLKNLKNKSAVDELFYIAKAGNPHSMYFDNLVNMGLLFFYWAGMMVYIFYFQLKEVMRLKKDNSKEFIISLSTLALTISFAITGILGSAWDDFLQRHVFLIGLILFETINKKIN